MKVAIVHYWLVSMRGGEKVLEALLELFPQADIYTHVYDPARISDTIKRCRIYTTYINALPFAKKLYQKYMPLMPHALKELDLQQYDLVISSESGPAKGIVPNPDAFHICYCHSPMRYIWDMYHEYFSGAGWFTRFFMKKLVPQLRVWDITSANMVDHFVTNSHYVARRIARYYNRQADVIYPPADIARYTALERQPSDFYLFFGQITGYKRADIAIDACIKLKKKLILIGDGDVKKMRKKYRAYPNITFAGRVSDDEAARCLSQAKALLFPGIEDFGIVPIEATSAGCPVIAYKKGGALDTIQEGVTGIFFEEQTADSLAEAIERFETLPTHTFADRQAFTRHVQQFSKEAFQERIKSVINARKRL